MGNSEKGPVSHGLKRILRNKDIAKGAHVIMSSFLECHLMSENGDIVIIVVCCAILHKDINYNFM